MGMMYSRSGRALSGRARAFCCTSSTCSKISVSSLRISGMKRGSAGMDGRNFLLYRGVGGFFNGAGEECWGIGGAGRGLGRAGRCKNTRESDFWVKDGVFFWQGGVVFSQEIARSSQVADLGHTGNGWMTQGAVRGSRDGVLDGGDVVLGVVQVAGDGRRRRRG